jgi:hypothetical protein
MICKKYPKARTFRAVNFFLPLLADLRSQLTRRNLSYVDNPSLL